MKKKILRITPGMTHCHHYRDILKLDETESGSELQALYAKQEIFMPGSWCASMAKLDVEAIDVVYWDVPMLRATLNMSLEKAQLNDFSKRLLAREVENPDNLIAAIIYYLDPDFVVCYAGGMLCVDNKKRKIIDDIVGRRVNWVGFWADELPKGYSYDEFFENLTHLFASTESYRELFAQHGFSSRAINNSFSLNGFNIPIKKVSERAIDLLFVGSTGYGMIEHEKRYAFLSELCADPSINIKIISWEPEVSNAHSILLKWKARAINFLVSCPSFIRKVISMLNVIGFRPIETAMSVAERVRNGEKLDTIYPGLKSGYSFYNNKKPLYRLFPSKVRREVVFGQAYLEHLASAKVVINVHREEVHDYGNIRCFEVPGMGCVLISDKVERMSEYFEDGKEYIGFDGTIDDFKMKFFKLINDPQKLEEISTAGREKVSRCYTSDNHCASMAEELFN